MNNDALIEKIDKIVRPVADELNYEIYHIEYIKESGEYYLRIYIDKEDGIALSDCESLSRRISETMDIEDPIEDAYFLEVSSPGLNRSLFTQEHFKNSIGKEVFVKFKSLDGKADVTGILKEVSNESIIIEANPEIIVESKTKAKARAKAEAAAGVKCDAEVKLVTVLNNQIQSANLEGEI